MPRRQATSIQNSFIQGLITERTALQFPENACTEADNTDFSETGRVTRRRGIDLEDSYTFHTVDDNAADDEAYVEFLWRAVSGVGTKTFLVQQKGQTIYFFDVVIDQAISDGKSVYEIDLTAFKPASTTLEPRNNPCQFTSGNGDLMVVNRACTPFFISYDSDDASFESSEINIQIRDFEGVNDYLDNNERPSSSVATLITANPEHYYNLLNQGWHATDALTQWDTARSDLPSNNDVFFLYRSTPTDAFDNNMVVANSFGNRLAPKGHFLLNPFSPDRVTALTNEGFSSVTFGGAIVAIDSSLGTNIGDLTSGGGLAACFDNDFDEPMADCATRTGTSGYAGKNYSALSGRKIAKVRISGSNNGGYNNALGEAMRIRLRAKASAPASITDGTLLADLKFNAKANEAAPKALLSTDPNTVWNYAWVGVAEDDSGSGTFTVGEVQFFTRDATVSEFSTFERPQCVEFFAGRVFYAGVSESSLSNSIFFSQIVEKTDQYGKCYQKNDPSSEDFVDLLEDDGGVIKIPDMGEVRRLFTLFRSLVVFASNGVWVISGSGGNSFKADDYTVSKVSSVGTTSGLSIVDARGIPLWWAEDGIYRVAYDSQFNSITVENITDQTIRTVVSDIKQINRNYVKGAFDSSKNVITWIYNSSSSLAQANYYVYDRFLHLNVLSGAFYQGSFTGTPKVRGVVSAFTSNSIVNQLKFTTTVTISSTSSRLTYSEKVSSNWKDWNRYSLFTGVSSDEKDYTSYFITGYSIHGETQRFFQPNYVFVFLETESNASCRMQGTFDYSFSASSGKWSTLQQIYTTEPDAFRDIKFRRLKVRGKGRALQLRFISETGKPFTIIGWSMLETQNANI